MDRDPAPGAPPAPANAPRDAKPGLLPAPAAAAPATTNGHGPSLPPRPPASRPVTPAVAPVAAANPPTRPPAPWTEAAAHAFFKARAAHGPDWYRVAAVVGGGVTGADCEALASQHAAYLSLPPRFQHPVAFAAMVRDAGAGGVGTGVATSAPTLATTTTHAGSEEAGSDGAALTAAASAAAPPATSDGADSSAAASEDVPAQALPPPKRPRGRPRRGATPPPFADRVAEPLPPKRRRAVPARLREGGDLGYAADGGAVDAAASDAAPSSRSGKRPRATAPPPLPHDDDAADALLSLAALAAAAGEDLPPASPPAKSRSGRRSGPSGRHVKPYPPGSRSGKRPPKTAHRAPSLHDSQVNGGGTMVAPSLGSPSVFGGGGFHAAGDAAASAPPPRLHASVKAEQGGGLRAAAAPSRTRAPPPPLRRHRRKAAPERALPHYAHGKALFAKRAPSIGSDGVVAGLATGALLRSAPADAPPAQLRLRAALASPRFRRWAAAEFFMAAIDAPWFAAGGGLVGVLEAAGAVPPGATAPRSQWAALRSALGRPRRLSLAFLRQERAALAAWRAAARASWGGAPVPPAAARAAAASAPLPPPLPVGGRVTARHPHARALADGVILTAGPPGAYRVQFDDSSLGVHLVSDTCVAPSDSAPPPPRPPLASAKGSHSRSPSVAPAAAAAVAAVSPDRAAALAAAAARRAAAVAALTAAPSLESAAGLAAADGEVAAALGELAPRRRGAVARSGLPPPPSQPYAAAWRDAVAALAEVSGGDTVATLSPGDAAALARTIARCGAALGALRAAATTRAGGAPLPAGLLDAATAELTAAAPGNKGAAQAAAAALADVVALLA